MAALRPTAMSLIPDTALFLFPTGPHALAVHWPQAGAGIWNCRAVPLGYMVPFRKLSFHFQFPFIFFTCSERMWGWRTSGCLFQSMIFHKVWSRKQGRTKCNAVISKIFFLKRKEKNPLNDHENLNCQAGFGVKQGEI